jgi:hypothetical protein
MSQNLSQSADYAATDPQLFFSSSVGNDSGETRSSGLILTKEQLINLKRYEIAGLALPTALQDVITYLGYSTGAGRGLEATDFQATFTLINNHAKLWNPLRTDLLTVSDKLVIFAGSMQVYGESMAEVFRDITIVTLIEQRGITTLAQLRELQAQMGSRFPGIEKADREDLGYYLDNILKKVKEQEEEAISIQTRLKAFSEQLSRQVAPAIKLQLASINNNSLSADIKALQVTIDERAKAIDEKTKEYNQLVKEAVGNVLGNLALLIYSSVQAEKIRKERNALRKRQETDIALMETKNRILASLGRVRMDLQDLDLIVIDADIATKNLITVWNKLATFISESSTEVNGINDGLSMRRFRNQFNLVVKPWETIEQDAKALLDVFAEADAQFREDYGVAK